VLLGNIFHVAPAKNAPSRQKMPGHLGHQEVSAQAIVFTNVEKTNLANS
jgi:hypothetical protein